MNSTPVSGAQHPSIAPDPAPAPAARPRASPLVTIDPIEMAAVGRSILAFARRPAIRTPGGRWSALSPPSGYATQASDFAFLKDPRLSLEQKLIRFYALYSKKLEEDIARLKDPSKASKSSSSSKAASTKKKGGIFGKFVKAIGEKVLKPALSKLAGPILAAGASALGFPMLAPILLKAAPALAGVATEALASLATGAASAATSSAAAASSSPSPAAASSASSSSAAGSGDDRVQMLELQQAVDKQKEMFTLVSNLLRSLHDMRMSAIQNIR
jgi:hypothetical protein